MSPAQVMSKEKAVETMVEARREYNAAAKRREEAKTALAKADREVEAALGKQESAEGHLRAAIMREVGE